MKYLIKNKHWNIVEYYNIDKILYLLIDRPSHINIINSFYWFNDNNCFHRNYDFPSFICYDGYISWHKNNSLHRENNKPAVIHKIDKKVFYINNIFIKEEKTK